VSRGLKNTYPRVSSRCPEKLMERVKIRSDTASCRVSREDGARGEVPSLLSCWLAYTDAIRTPFSRPSALTWAAVNPRSGRAEERLMMLLHG
jgi:hypothetical protein